MSAKGCRDRFPGLPVLSLPPGRDRTGSKNAGGGLARMLIR